MRSVEWHDFWREARPKECYPPGSICPVCGNTDVEMDDGEGKCLGCQSEFRIKLTLESYSMNPCCEISLDGTPIKNEATVKVQIDAKPEGGCWYVVGNKPWDDWLCVQ